MLQHILNESLQGLINNLTRISEQSLPLLKSPATSPLRVNALNHYTLVWYTNLIVLRTRILPILVKTKRHLLTRVKEHQSIHSKSAIFDHIASCNCEVSYENFRIIFRAKETYSLSIAEALLIKDRRPILNRTLANNGACLYLKL